MASRPTSSATREKPRSPPRTNRFHARPPTPAWDACRSWGRDPPSNRPSSLHLSYPVIPPVIPSPLLSCHPFAFLPCYPERSEGSAPLWSHTCHPERSEGSAPLWSHTCHPERSEGSAPLWSHTCHPERSEGSAPLWSHTCHPERSE